MIFNPSQGGISLEQRNQEPCARGHHQAGPKCKSSQSELSKLITVTSPCPSTPWYKSSHSTKSILVQHPSSLFLLKWLFSVSTMVHPWNDHVRFHKKEKVDSYQEILGFHWSDVKRDRVRNRNQGLSMHMPKVMTTKLLSVVTQGWIQM